MSSIGVDISPQEATDLLHKLISERTTVQAVFTGLGFLSAGINGLVSQRPDGIVTVKGGRKTLDQFLRFDPSEAISFQFWDRNRVAEGKQTDRLIVSALSFIYSDKTGVTLFELTTKHDE
jgi:hypothetical protein